MTKYFLICASRDYVLKGVAGGFAQAGHGRKDLMSKPSKGDWIVFYSAKDNYDNGKPLQKFTPIGQVVDEEPYQPDANGNFKPYRRNVVFEKVRETEICPLLEQLSFIKNKKSWGFYLISKVFPLEQVAEAHQAGETKQVKGKMVLEIRKEEKQA